MAMQVAPTKSNLLKAKASLELSKSGYELLDKKRNVLIREMMELVEKAKSMQTGIGDIMAQAYLALQNANITMGIQKVDEIAYSIPKDEKFEVLPKSVMGSVIPTIRYEKGPLVPHYSFYESNSAFDKAALKFKEAQYQIYELAVLENSIYKLAKEIEKTQKRTNALSNIQIPKYKEQVKQISESLEEKEREDFFRLKKIKK
ncbi:V-type ATP synthase subunit D [Candidatus Epulonipiscium viviparus]|uniref:V-type ATP synthase subunit D n=1 Tax=Candidatus Epulonipiscium viviparus TaxID=420336 RepID=UPI00016C0303|nr:V-type ATP synthase subunit D [Candidatus Epulopiscium viviparus]